MDGIAWQGCLRGVTLASFAFAFLFFCSFPNIGGSSLLEWDSLIRQIRDTRQCMLRLLLPCNGKVILQCMLGFFLLGIFLLFIFLVNGIAHSMKQYRYTCFTRICQNPKLVVATLGEETGAAIHTVHTISCFFGIFRKCDAVKALTSRRSFSLLLRLRRFDLRQRGPKTCARVASLVQELGAGHGEPAPQNKVPLCDGRSRRGVSVKCM